MSKKEIQSFIYASYQKMIAFYAHATCMQIIMGANIIKAIMLTIIIMYNLRNIQYNFLT